MELKKNKMSKEVTLENMQYSKNEPVIKIFEWKDPFKAVKLKSMQYSQYKPVTEIFKIKIEGLCINFLTSELEILLNETLKLEASVMKPDKKSRTVAFFNFKDEEKMLKAISILNGYEWQGSMLSVREAVLRRDPMLLGSPTSHFLRGLKKKYQELPLRDQIKRILTPYHVKPYKDQIEIKDRVLRRFLSILGTDLARQYPKLKDFVQWHKFRRKGQICEIDEFIESPIRQGYLNKCEFTIGKEGRGSDKTIVGFRVTRSEEDPFEVGSVDHLTPLNDKMKEVVKYIESYLETSKHAPYDPFLHDGVWRKLIVRTSRNSDVMIIIQINSQNLSEGELNDLKGDVKEYFTEGGGGTVGITSIYFQRVCQNGLGKEAEYEYVYGKTYIEETLLGKTFRASPDTYLQVNTPACEVLYKKIAEVAEIDSTSIVLDVCCGVGTFALSIAKTACKILGVEYIQSDFENAKRNAENNGIENAVFYNGKFEDFIHEIVDRSQVDHVAIVAPPKGKSIDFGVLNALRKCIYINKIVYVTCETHSALSNFYSLSKPEKLSQEMHFVPIRAIPIDLFPDTPHFGLIMVFERNNECKWNKIMTDNPRPEDKEYYNRLIKLMQENLQKELEEQRRLKSAEDKKTAKRKAAEMNKNNNNNNNNKEKEKDNLEEGTDEPKKKKRRVNENNSINNNDNNNNKVNNRNHRESRSGEDEMRNYGNKFGNGFHEGFQAGLEASRGRLTGFDLGVLAFHNGFQARLEVLYRQFMVFGQRGVFNMVQPQQYERWPNPSRMG